MKERDEYCIYIFSRGVRGVLPPPVPPEINAARNITVPSPPRGLQYFLIILSILLVLM